jgi:hypothetical protein
LFSFTLTKPSFHRRIGWLKELSHKKNPTWLVPGRGLQQAGSGDSTKDGSNDDKDGDDYKEKEDVPRGGEKAAGVGERMEAGSGVRASNQPSYTEPVFL